jgi:hypothetical protein
MPDLASDLAPLLAGKVVIDTGNAYEKRDGASAREASGHAGGSAGWAAGFFPNARWVKGFNTVYFKTLESEAHRDGRSGRHSAGERRPRRDRARCRPRARRRLRSSHRGSARERQGIRAGRARLQHRHERT